MNPIYYALEIIKPSQDKDFKSLNSNLNPFFWIKVDRVIRLNRKGLLPQ